MKIGGILRRADVKYFKYKYLLDVIRSSCFLAVNGGGLVVYVCLLRSVYFDDFVIVLINPLTPVSDQDRISPYNINTLSTR